MAKKKVDKKVTESKESPWSALPRAELEPAPPKSDMWAIYREIRTQIEDADLKVNSTNSTETQVRIDREDFVKDCMAMIPAIGISPEYAVWNFSAMIHCVVPKGDNTVTRLEILKNVVRAALIGKPFILRGFNISIIITDEKNGRALGVRTSALSLLINVERIRKVRR